MHSSMVIFGCKFATFVLGLCVVIMGAKSCKLLNISFNRYRRQKSSCQAYCETTEHYIQRGAQNIEEGICKQNAEIACNATTYK